VGYTRRNLFLPILEGEDLDDINRQLLERCREEDDRIAERAIMTIGAAFQVEKGSLLPLPQRPYDCCRVLSVKIAGKTSTFGFDKNRYSVPVEYVYQTLTLKVYPNHLEVCRGNEVVAVHQRLHGVEYEDSLDPLHYLPCLQRKPALLEHGKPFVNWKLPEEFARYLEALRVPYGEKAKREYVRVLMQLQHYRVEEVAGALGQALRAGTCDPGAVISLLKVRERDFAASTSGSEREPDVSWSHIRVLQPTCAGFDALLSQMPEEVAA
jgi:hypothetical protein